MSIRFRLTIAAIAVILVANSLLSFLALQYLGRVWMGEVQTRVAAKSEFGAGRLPGPSGGDCRHFCGAQPALAHSPPPWHETTGRLWKQGCTTLARRKPWTLSA